MLILSETHYKSVLREVENYSEDTLSLFSFSLVVSEDIPEISSYKLSFSRLLFSSVADLRAFFHASREMSRDFSRRLAQLEVVPAAKHNRMNNLNLSVSTPLSASRLADELRRARKTQVIDSIVFRKKKKKK